MEEQLITLETAKLAKEKGFMEMTLTYAILGQGGVKFPTQSLLQKWLREEHNIQMVIEVGVKYIDNKLTDLYSYQFFRTSPQLKRNWNFSSKKYLSYEEALEKGLQEALKLIKS